MPKSQIPARPRPGSFAQYLKSIEDGRPPALPADAYTSLLLAAKAGDEECRRYAVAYNLPLVIYLTRPYIGYGVDLDDLVQEGNVGLLEAIPRWEPERATFTTCASVYIKRGIRYALRQKNNKYPVRVANWVHDLVAKWRKVEAEIASETGAVPLPATVIARLGIGKRRAKCVVKAKRVLECGVVRVARGCSAYDDGDEPLLELADDNSDEVAAMLDDRDAIAKLQGALEAMTTEDFSWARRASIIVKRFGLDGGDPMTLLRVGQDMSVTRERVRQLQGEGLARLKEAVGA